MKLILGLLLSMAFTSGNEQFAKHFNQNQNMVALNGIDVVSFFKQQKAVPGQEKFSVDQEAVSFWFSSIENADAFESDPEKYLPAYGGWSATDIATNSAKVDIDPNSFVIDNGILYLFAPGKKQEWISNSKRYKEAADKNWQQIYSN